MIGMIIWFSFGFAMFHRGFDYVGYDGYAATHTGYLLHSVRTPFPVKNNYEITEKNLCLLRQNGLYL